MNHQRRRRRKFSRRKGHHPSRDWLSFVKSSSAKSKIRHWINEQEREEATEMGKRLLENEARHFGRSLKKIPEADMLKLVSDYGLSKVEDLYAPSVSENIPRARCSRGCLVNRTKP